MKSFTKSLSFLSLVMVMAPMVSFAGTLTATCTEINSKTGKPTGGRINLYTEKATTGQQGRRYITDVKISNIPRLKDFRLNPLHPHHQVQEDDLLNFQLEKRSLDGRLIADLSMWFNFAERRMPAEHFNTDVDSFMNSLKNAVGLGVTHEDMDDYAVGNHEINILNNGSFKNAKSIPMSFQCFKIKPRRRNPGVVDSSRDSNTDGRDTSRRSSTSRPSRASSQ